MKETEPKAYYPYYPDILERQYKRSFLPFVRDFKPKESDRIMMDITLKIMDVEKEKRGIGTRFISSSLEGDRITTAEIRSSDGVIKIELQYNPPHIVSVYSDYRVMASIEKFFMFNSNNPNDKEEYLSLCDIIKKPL